MLDPLADSDNGSPEFIDASDSGSAEMCLKLGEGHLNGIEIGAVRRQKQKLVTACPDGNFDSLLWL